MGTHHVLGVRHHGPGSARAVLHALERLDPDAVLVEGPPEGDVLLPLIPRCVPPVALLVYARDDPSVSARYPLAHFSPEWQAIRWAVDRDVPVRFMDLPVGSRFREERPVPVGEEEVDPMSLLARAAGFQDPDLWWEHAIELRPPADLFDAVLEAMSALRGPRVPETEDPHLRWLARREAHMRLAVREEVKRRERVAVVCGAYHAPALLDLSGVTADRQLLKGLRRAPVVATWVPWSWSRLTFRSGYGAGVASPGWYAEVWEGTEGLAARWLSRVARLLREEGLHVSAAHVVEAVRLAEALGALRERRPALAELHEAIRSVMATDAPMALIRRKLDVGEGIGAVPDEAPAVPLQQDVHRKQRRLRFKAATEPREVDLDLRNDTHRARSHLLHQLLLLDVPWGRRREHFGEDLGTFHERWVLAWDPELEVRLVEASVWGNTTEEAATARVARRAEASPDLPALSELLDEALLADLADAVLSLLDRLAELAALASDVLHLMEAIPPLARVARYGDVRRTPSERLRPVLEGLFERAVVGLPAAVRGLSDDAAAGMARRIAGVDDALGLLGREDLGREWCAALLGVADDETVHPRIRGRADRLLLERRVLDEAALTTRARLALAPSRDPREVVGWLEGLLTGSGLVVLHLDGLWDALDAWLTALPEEDFVAVLPVLRRSFSAFDPAERRAMGEKARGARAARREEALDPRADLVW